MKRKTTHDTAIDSLAADAQALIQATASSAEEKVIAARDRLSRALENGHAMWEHVQERAVESVKATDRAIREHPYQSIGIGIGIGAVLGYLFARR